MNLKGRPKGSRNKKGSYGRAEVQCRHRRRLREDVLAAYGKSCAKCGFADARALQIDHIKGGGGKHILLVGGGMEFYRWLRKEGFPPDYQTLCANCNWIKRHENNEIKVTVPQPRRRLI